MCHRLCDVLYDLCWPPCNLVKTEIGVLSQLHMNLTTPCGLISFSENVGLHLGFAQVMPLDLVSDGVRCSKPHRCWVESIPLNSAFWQFKTTLYLCYIRTRSPISTSPPSPSSPSSSSSSIIVIIPQQRKLMGSLAQNSSGVHWCGHRVGFNEVPKRFRIRFNRVPQRFRRRIREALVQSQVMFNRVPEKVPEALVQSQVRFNRVLEKVPEKVPEKVTGGFGETGQVQQGSGEGSGDSSGGEALVQSQVRFNRVPEKVPEEVWEALV